MGNLLKNVPKPILKKANRIIEDALYESKESQSPKTVKTTVLKTQEMGRVVYRDEISMNEIINWAKSHYPSNVDSAKFVVLKEKSDNLDYDYLLYMIFVNGNTPLLGTENSSMAIYSKKLDETLSDTFGNNDIIEFE